MCSSRIPSGTRGARWVDAFIDFYLNEKRVCDLGESCAVQSLVPEIGRTPGHVRTAVGERLAGVAKAIADGLPEGKAPERLDRAWALLAILSGGVSLARAMGGQAQSDAIARAVGRVAREAVASRKQPAPPQDGALLATPMRASASTLRRIACARQRLEVGHTAAAMCSRNQRCAGSRWERSCQSIAIS